ncbi:MAG: hypothetical protein Ct9H300mP24_8860 [Candidatus Neomarinimicrobiota bacterium]|nr:MAG: hypothetical protein Ct9H300mP24_8860 [Candidatus Neomarinimicrobiota bacterium]
MNVKKDNLNQVLGIIPSLESPTISELSSDEWYSVNPSNTQRRISSDITIFKKICTRFDCT